MKKIIAVVLVLIVIIVCTGCAKYEAHFDNMAIEYIHSAGFEFIEKMGNFGDYRTYLAYDTRTNVEYIVTFGNGTNGFCPYYDEYGNIAIYGGK